MEPRVIRVAIPMFRNARAVAGRTRWRTASPAAGRFPARSASRIGKWVIWGNGGVWVENAYLYGRLSAGPIARAPTRAARYGGPAHPLKYNVRTTWSGQRPGPLAASPPRGRP